MVNGPGSGVEVRIRIGSEWTEKSFAVNAHLRSQLKQPVVERATTAKVLLASEVCTFHVFTSARVDSGRLAKGAARQLLRLLERLNKGSLLKRHIEPLVVVTLTQCLYLPIVVRRSQAHLSIRVHLPVTVWAAHQARVPPGLVGAPYA